MRRRFKVVFIFLLLFLFGCASNIRKPLKKPFLTEMNTWPVVYRANFQKIHTFVGRAKVTIESQQFSGRVQMKTIWVRPDTLYLKAEGPLGIDVGQIFMGKNRFIIYNQLANQFVSGNLDDPYFARFMETDFQLQQLKDAFIGQAPLPVSGIRLIDGKKGIFESKGNQYRYVYRINPVTGLIQEVQFVQNGKAVLKEQFKNYTRIEGVYLPRIINIILIEKKERLSVFYDSIHLNERIDARVYTIKVDSKVKQLNLN